MRLALRQRTCNRGAMQHRGPSLPATAASAVTLVIVAIGLLGMTLSAWAQVMISNTTATTTDMLPDGAGQ